MKIITSGLASLMALPSLTISLILTRPTKFQSIGNHLSKGNRIFKQQDSRTICHAHKSSNTKTVHKDVLIIGAGLAGLATGLHLATKFSGADARQVTIVDSMSVEESYSSQNVAGSFAAAGMLAPQSERLPPGPLLDLCLKSRSIYPEFVSMVEELARDSGSEAEHLLWKGKSDSIKETLEPWEVGFHCTGGFLAPAFAGDSVATWAPPAGSGNARWLDDIQVHELEPQLHPSVVGGWWFPEDASVDARRLTCSLRAACVAAGVHLQLGKSYGVKSLELQDGSCKAVRLQSGKTYTAKTIIVANGSWMRNLIPVPITPHKGQSLSLRMPSNQPPILNRVLFAQDTYIVPKSDGRIVVGATVEPGSFDPSVTPAGMLHCIENACRLMPELRNLPIEESWSGLRPTTPDKAPILGRTSWNNLYVAGGYWRNGVLLAPKTGQLIGDLVQGTLNEEDAALLEAFTWERFVAPGGGQKLAMEARYASSFYPTQRRAKGFGVSAAVGTELGFYSDASAAKDERAQDREAMFGSSDESLEKAAQMGLNDASHFSFGVDNKLAVDLNKTSQEAVSHEHKATENGRTPVQITRFDSSGLDKSGVHATKQNNKMIHNVDMQSAAEVEKLDMVCRADNVESPTNESSQSTLKSIGFDAIDVTIPDETTYDGYIAIQAANGAGTRQDQLERMKRSRLSNRSLSDVDYTEIGAAPWQNDGKQNQVTAGISEVEKTESDKSLPPNQIENLPALYERIKINKQANADSTKIEMGEKFSDNRSDPGFRIYRIDAETGESVLVPPYTRPEEMDRMIKSSNKKLDSKETISSNSEEVRSFQPDETTYDGYVAIQERNGFTREEQLSAMRAARLANRGESNDGAKTYS